MSNLSGLPQGQRFFGQAIGSVVFKLRGVDGDARAAGDGGALGTRREALCNSGSCQQALHQQQQDQPRERKPAHGGLPGLFWGRFDAWEFMAGPCLLVGQVRNAAKNSSESNPSFMWCSLPPRRVTRNGVPLPP